MRVLLLLLLSLTVVTVEAQIQVSGRITQQADNAPAIGVTVMVQGTTTGTVTDFDGQYSITVPDRNAVLVFSYTGFASQK